MPSPSGVTATRASFADLVRYFLYLGGFGGPVALAGFMHRDLVETRCWIDEEEYRLALALARSCRAPSPRSSPSRSDTSSAASSARPR